MANLKVSYSVIDSVNSNLNSLFSSPEHFFLPLGQLRQEFSTSKSACAKELIAALDRYEEIYRLIWELKDNSVTMLNTAKLMYSNLDTEMNRDMTAES